MLITHTHTQTNKYIFTNEAVIKHNTVAQFNDI